MTTAKEEKELLLEKLLELQKAPEVVSGFKSKSDCLSWCSKIAPLLKFADPSLYPVFMSSLGTLQATILQPTAEVCFDQIRNYLEMAIEKLKHEIQIDHHASTTVLPNPPNKRSSGWIGSRDFKIAITSTLIAGFLLLVVEYDFFSKGKEPKEILAQRISEIQKTQLKDNFGAYVQKLEIHGNAEFFMSPSAMPEDAARLLLQPTGFEIAYTDPANPKNPHALIQITAYNEGSQTISDVHLKWEIHDGYASITPPDEWRRSQGQAPEEIGMVMPRSSFSYLYGPEIGGNAPQNYEAGKKRFYLAITAQYKLKGSARELESSWKGYAIFDVGKNQYLFLAKYASPPVDPDFMAKIAQQHTSKYVAEPGLS